MLSLRIWPPTEAGINRVRLYTGIILFVYIAGHLINAALGLIGVGAMNRGLAVAELVWGGPIGQIALGGSFVVHFLLALRALYGRSAWRMPPAEAAQMALGFLIPLLLATHFAGTRYLIATQGATVDYSAILYAQWIVDPIGGWMQIMLVVIAWMHGCIGIGYNLRLRPWYASARSYLLVASVLVPVLALLGYYEGGRAIVVLAQDPAWVAALHRHSGITPVAASSANGFALGQRFGVVLCIVLVVAARLLRGAVNRRRGLLTLTYPDGGLVRIAPGLTVLEASRQAGIPHASVCGGRGRCSTCRIRVSGADGSMPMPAEDERAVLRRVGLPENIRLACRLRPTGDIAVTPLLAIDKALPRARRALTGSEREIAILFCDIRAFTKLSEHKLPYDVVFMLNRYFAEMGAAIENAGGRVDKFIGDGVMGLFGVDGTPAQGCREALAAAAEMSRRIGRLNQELAHDLPEPLRIGIGIHAGPVILGEMGWGNAIGLTAIGDVVNTASRLEALSKEFGVELVVSAEVAKFAEGGTGGWPQRETAVRGRSDPLTVYALTSARQAAEVMA